MILSEIHIYPIKSLGGISLQSAEVEDRGLQYDRRWVLVDESNTFFTQRDFPEMGLINVTVENDRLHLQHKKKNIEPLNKIVAPYDLEPAFDRLADMVRESLDIKRIYRLLGLK